MSKHPQSKHSQQTTIDSPSLPHPPNAEPSKNVEVEQRPKEIGGRKGPDPTRYGDWEKAGRCIDF